GCTPELLGQRNGSAAREAVGEVERRSGVASPQRVAAAAELCAGACDLSDRVHCEGASTLKPQLIPRPLEQGQEGVPVTCNAVAKVRPFRQRAGSPRELATGEEQTPMFIVVWRQGSKRGDHTGCTVTPLHPDQPVSIAGETLDRGTGRPVGKSVLQDDVPSHGLRCPTMNLVISITRQGQDAACEPVRRTDELIHDPVEVLGPEARAGS